MAKRTARTTNGDLAYSHTGSHFTEFFSKAGSLRAPDGKPNRDLINLFNEAFKADRMLALRLMFWSRGFREGGAGNRSGFRCILNWLAKNEPDIAIANVHFIPKYGRWDDLYALYGTEAEEAALSLWAGAIRNQDRLACKWADRKDRKLGSYMRLCPKAFRQMVVAGSNTVEQLMCAKAWDEIVYQGVPSKAMAMYCKAFAKNDNARYTAYKGALVKGEAKVNTGALNPIDVVVSCIHGDSQMAELQFNAMKPLFADGKRPMAVTDFSGSMTSAVPGSKYSALAVALSLGMYFSGKMEKSNPFHKKFLAFSSNYKMIDWSKWGFATAVKRITDENGFVESTNIEKALRGLLADGLRMGATAKDFPTHLVIISDMQFNGGCCSSSSAIESAMKDWDRAEIPRPAIIYWNVSEYKTSPASAFDKNVALVSGFSPGIAQAILSVDSTDTFAIMMKAIQPYEAVLP